MLCFAPEFSELEVRSTVVFNPEEHLSLQEENDSELKGAEVRTHKLLLSCVCICVWLHFCVMTSGPALCRLTDAALAVTEREWFITPGRWDQLMKDRPSSLPVYTAGKQHKPVWVYVCVCELQCDLSLTIVVFVFQVSGEGGLLTPFFCLCSVFFFLLSPSCLFLCCSCLHVAVFSVDRVSLDVCPFRIWVD